MEPALGPAKPDPWEDVNDHDELRHDPVLALFADGEGLTTRAITLRIMAERGLDVGRHTLVSEMARRLSYTLRCQRDKGRAGCVRARQRDLAGVAVTVAALSALAA